jgi:hypothetical protein
VGFAEPRPTPPASNKTDIALGSLQTMITVAEMRAMIKPIARRYGFKCIKSNFVTNDSVIDVTVNLQKHSYSDGVYVNLYVVIMGSSVNPDEPECVPITFQCRPISCMPADVHDVLRYVEFGAFDRTTLDDIRNAVEHVFAWLDRHITTWRRFAESVLDPERSGLVHCGVYDPLREWADRVLKSEPPTEHR